MNPKQIIKVTMLVISLSTMMVVTTACSETIETRKGEKVIQEKNIPSVGEPDHMSKEKKKAEVEEAFRARVNVHVLKGFTFDAEEPGRFILQSEEDGAYFSRIEVLGSEVNLNDEKEKTKLALGSIGEVKQLSSNAEQLYAFYEHADFAFYVANKNANQVVVVKKVDNMYLKVSTFSPYKEESLKIASQMVSILETLKITI